MIISVDGLTGFSNAIKAVFPNTEVQRYIVHQIRNTFKYISYKHRKEFASDLKLVYTSSTEEAALSELTLLEKNETNIMR
ncbi:MAG: transposase [Romboutsia sp.]